MQTFIRKLRYIINGSHEPPVLTDQVIEVSDSQFESYSSVIGSLIPYFNDLPTEGKKNFVQRVHHFKSAKNFHFVGLEQDDNTKTLVCASAIQVTFGLKNYLLSHFENIYVLADAYNMENDELFEQNFFSLQLGDH